MEQLIHSLPYAGELFALLTAITWAFGVVLFRKSGETAHPIALNLFKNILALLLILPTMLLLGEALMRPVPIEDYLIALVSGALGIGIADTLFFRSLNLLGAGVSAIIDCLYSPFTIGLSVLWLGDHLSLLQMIGAIMIVSAVLTATNTRQHMSVSSSDFTAGMICGVLAIAAISVSIVMVKPMLARSPVLWVTEIRLIGGLMVLGMVLALHPGRYGILSSLAVRSGWKYTLSASFVGTYLAIILWLVGMKFTQTSVAAALNQTSNIFIFIFAALFLHEPIRRQHIISIVLGVIGSFLVTFS